MPFSSLQRGFVNLREDVEKKWLGRGLFQTHFVAALASALISAVVSGDTGRSVVCDVFVQNDASRKTLMLSD